jgi:NitT/TauT family transport system substrate-binding protein
MIERRNRDRHHVTAFSFSAALSLVLLQPPIAHAAETVRLGVAQTMSDAAYYVAQDKGYFRDEGIDLKLTTFNSAAGMVAPLGTGELDVGGGTVSAALYNAASRGVSVKIVADEGSMRPGYGYSSLLVRKDLVEGGRFKSFADLKGLKIAAAAPGSGSASAINEALKKGGLKFSDADVVYMGFPDQLAAFRNKAIDAGIANEPTMTLIRDEGLATRFAGNDTYYPGQVTAVVLYSPDFIARRATAEAFMRAYLRGLRDYAAALKDGSLSGPGAAAIIGILTARTPVKDAALYGRIVPTSADPDGRVNLATLQNDLAFYRAQGLVKNDKIAVEDVYDGSFAAAAVKALGPYRREP